MAALGMMIGGAIVNGIALPALVIYLKCSIKTVIKQK
jgi:hypothetical protein